jgi:diaminohydroxyphosphoribosylaminopyrimidine deaminase/5-amino-6-(5-phosphoribosylamino)uracil reductase
MVGCIIVRDGRVIGEGYHRCCGEEHAEINALRSAAEPVEGATVYVTLEPCSHYGRTPPCAEALVARRPARVVIGTRDPNPLVAGNGIAALTKAGIETTVGVLADRCRTLNERFFKFMETGRPFVTLKYAQTLDGRIATATGHSRWISSPPSLAFAHRLRSIHDAILVGVGTVLQDDPELTVRLVRGRNPLRVVVDAGLRMPLEAKLLREPAAAGTMLAVTGRAPQRKIGQVLRKGVQVLQAPDDGQGRVDLAGLFALLGKRGVTSVLVEGGSQVITTVLRERLADRIVVVVAPKILGKGIEAVGDLNIRRMDEALGLKWRKVFRRGEDMIFDGVLRDRETTPRDEDGT